MPLRTDLAEAYWQRGRNPVGAALRIVVAIGLFAAIWFRSPGWIAATFVGIIVTMFAFPPVRGSHNYLTRAIDGQHLWMTQTPLFQLAALYAMGIPVTVLLVVSLWTHNAPIAWSVGALVVAIKVGFIVYLERMASRADYDRATGPRRPSPPRVA